MLTTHGATLAGRRALPAGVAGVHHRRRHRRAGLADARPRDHRPEPAAAGHPRRTAQRLERRRRRDAPLPPGARRPRLDRAAGQPARQRRLRRGTSTTPSSAPGARRTRRTSSSRSTHLVAEGIADPKRLARHRLQLRRLHDLLPHRPRRPLRRGRRRRRGRRPDRAWAARATTPSTCQRLELGAMPWAGRSRPARRACRRTRTSTTSRTPTLVLHGADDVRCPVGQAQQWHYALASGASRPAWCSTPAPATSSRSTGKPSPPDRLRPRASSTGSSSTPATPPARARRRSTRRTGSGASRRSRERHRVPGAQLGILRLRDRVATDELVARRHGVLNSQHRRRRRRPTRSSRSGRSSKVWTATVIMRLIDEGQLEPRHPRRRDPARPAGSPTPTSTKRRHDPAPAHPHQRHRRRRVHRHRPRRRLPREVRRVARRCRAEPPARRDLVVLQLRLLRARPGDREGHRQDLGRRDARAALHAARTRPTPARCPRRRSCYRGRRRPRRRPRRRAESSRPSGACRAPPARPVSSPRRVARPARLRPAAPRRRRRRRRHAAAQPRRRPPRCSLPGRPARQVLARRLVGPRLDPLRLGRPPADRPRRQHASARRRSCGSCPRQRPRGRAADQRRQHPRPLRGPLPRDLRRARRTSRCSTR